MLGAIVVRMSDPSHSSPESVFKVWMGISSTYLEVDAHVYQIIDVHVMRNVVCLSTHVYSLSSSLLVSLQQVLSSAVPYLLEKGFVNDAEEVRKYSVNQLLKVNMMCWYHSMCFRAYNAC